MASAGSNPACQVDAPRTRGQNGTRRRPQSTRGLGAAIPGPSAFHGNTAHPRSSSGAPQAPEPVRFRRFSDAVYTDATERVAARMIEGFFEVSGIRPPSIPPPTTKSRLNPAKPASPAWADALSDQDARKVFVHLLNHGSVSEAELGKMLGSPRAVRKFALAVDTLVQQVPFRVRVDLLWVFTGTPEFFDTKRGVAGLQPLHDRIKFLEQGGVASLRQSQLALKPFDAGRLREVALKLREIYPTPDHAKLEAEVPPAYVEHLVADVTKGFGGDVGVVPRQFLRRLVEVFDLVNDEEDFHPMRPSGFVADKLTPVEERIQKGQPPFDSEPDDEKGYQPARLEW